MTRAKTAFLFVALLSLSACISGVKSPDTYTDRAGNTTIIQTDHEQCERACNETYSRCMDTEPAQTNAFRMPSGMVGASVDCRNDLQSCLPGCQGR
jgi:hypothetical protein